MRVSTDLEKYKKLRRIFGQNDAFFVGTTRFFVGATHFLSGRRYFFRARDVRKSLLV